MHHQPSTNQLTADQTTNQSYPRQNDQPSNSQEHISVTNQLQTAIITIPAAKRWHSTAFVCQSVVCQSVLNVRGGRRTYLMAWYCKATRKDTQQPEHQRPRRHSHTNSSQHKKQHPAAAAGGKVQDLVSVCCRRLMQRSSLSRLQCHLTNAPSNQPIDNCNPPSTRQQTTEQSADRIGCLVAPPPPPE